MNVTIFPPQPPCLIRQNGVYKHTLEATAIAFIHQLKYSGPSDLVTKNDKQKQEKESKLNF
jgi:hypothetical protein